MKIYVLSETLSYKDSFPKTIGTFSDIEYAKKFAKEYMSQFNYIQDQVFRGDDEQGYTSKNFEIDVFDLDNKPVEKSYSAEIYCKDTDKWDLYDMFDTKEEAIAFALKTCEQNEDWERYIITEHSIDYCDDWFDDIIEIENV